MRRWLTQYHWRFPRSLAYMLQASEYDLADFLAWYRRANDFRRVEIRKRFVPTVKSITVVGIAGGLFIGTVIAAVSALWWAGPWWIVLFIGLAAAPLVTVLGLAFAVFTGQRLIQRPIEFFIVQRARQRLAGHPAKKIAIAGSYGKTTMRELLKIVLTEGKRVAAPPHSYNTPLSISRFVAGLRGDEDILLFELGEYRPGDIRRLCRLVQPDIGVITGVNEAHLQKFKTLDRATNTIFELADWLGNRPVYVNAENALAKQRAAPPHTLYTRRGVGQVVVSDARTGLDGTDCILTVGQERQAVHTPLLGLHQLGPMAVAADVALHFGLSLQQIGAGLAKAKPFEHRLQPTVDPHGILLLDDSYNGNPDGVRAVIEFLGSLAGRRRWYVTPGLVEMGDHRVEIHRAIGRMLAAAGIEQVVLIRNSVTPDIADGLRQAGFTGQLHWFDDGPAAYAALPHLTVSGDVVLFQNDWPDQYA